MSVANELCWQSINKRSVFDLVFIVRVMLPYFNKPALCPRESCLLGLWLRLECSLDSLSIDSAHVIYVSEGYDVAYNRRTASQPSHVVLRVTWYVKTFRNVNYVC